MVRCLLLLAALVVPLPLTAGEMTLGVASNFLPVAESLAASFQTETDHKVTVVHGSTGQIYAQIVSGAPTDVFLSADRQRPELLVRDGLADAAQTYSIGRLMLVSRIAVDVEAAAPAFEGRRVALADPTVAPYGLAATAAMERLGLDTAAFQPLLVSNVGQVATLFATGNADLAFVAASLLPKLDAPYVVDLNGLHPPIRQDAALLTRAADNEAAQDFWVYLFSRDAQVMIQDAGYLLPE
jgi:molybdate transport system substrate-binding protein